MALDVAVCSGKSINTGSAQTLPFLCERYPVISYYGEILKTLVLSLSKRIIPKFGD